MEVEPHTAEVRTREHGPRAAGTEGGDCGNWNCRHGIARDKEQFLTVG